MRLARELASPTASTVQAWQLLGSLHTESPKARAGSEGAPAGAIVDNVVCSAELILEPLARRQVPQVADVRILFATRNVPGSRQLQKTKRPRGQQVGLLQGHQIASFEMRKTLRKLWAAQRVWHSRTRRSTPSSGEASTWCPRPNSKHHSGHNPASQAGIDIVVQQVHVRSM